MTTTSRFQRPLGLTCILLSLAFACTIRAQALTPVTLNTELLDKMDAAIKNIGSDAAVKADYNAATKEAGDKVETLPQIIDSKYPKVSAAFKSASLAPLDFLMGGLTIMTCMLQEQTGGDASADPNVTFYKANKERVAKTMSGIEGLDKP